MKALGAKIGAGAVWNVANMLLTRGASILFTLLLTKLLAPEAFGIIAMMSIFFGLADLVVNSGFMQALIRSASVSDIDLSTAFFSNILFGVLAYLALFLVAPLAAGFYEQPVLTDLIRVAGIVIFVNSLIIVQEAMLRRDMRFRTLMYASVAGTIVSGVLAIIMAYAGFGVWSLVAQMVASRLIIGVIIWYESTWRPTRSYSKDSFSRMFGFGYKLLLESAIDVLYLNSFFIVIGKLFSAELAGLYFLASKISDLIAPQISNAVAQASLPALSRIQHKPDDLRQTYRRIIGITMFLVAPLLAGMAVLSPLTFEVLMDARWKQSALFLQFFAFASLLFPIHTMNYNILTVKGRSDLVLWLGILRKSVNVVILLLCIPYGIYGILTGQIIASILALGPNTYFAARLINYSLAAQLSDIMRPVIAASLSGALVLLLISFLPQTPEVLLIIGVAAGLFSYVVLGRLICHPEFTATKQYIIDNTLKPQTSRVD